GDIAQGTAADAQDDENFAAGAEMLDGLIDLIDHFAFVGQVAVGKLAGAALLVHLVGDGANAGGDFLQLGGGDGMFGVDGFGGGVFVVVADLVHFSFPVGGRSISGKGKLNNSHRIAETQRHRH